MIILRDKYRITPELMMLAKRGNRSLIYNSFKRQYKQISGYNQSQSREFYPYF